MNIERNCEDCYKAEYMQQHIGEIFKGLISSVTEYGFYVELENTVEGLVHVNSLPEEIIFMTDFSVLLKNSATPFTPSNQGKRIMCRSRCKQRKN